MEEQSMIEQQDEARTAAANGGITASGYALDEAPPISQKATDNTGACLPEQGGNTLKERIW